MATLTNMTLSNIIFLEGKPEASDKNDILRLEGFKLEKNEENKRKMEIVNSRMPNSRMPTHFSRIAQKIGVNRPSRR